MGSLGQALGGLLGGYGDGLAKQAEIDQQNQRDDALTRRQLALSQAQADATTKREFALHEYDADRKDAATANELKLRAGYEKDSAAFKSGLSVQEHAANAATDFALEAKKLGIQFNNEEKIAAYKSKLAVDEYNKTKGQDNPITAEKIDENGQLVGVFQDGTTTMLAPGVKFRQPATLTDLFGGQGAGGDGDAAAGTKPNPSPTKQGLPTIGGGSSGGASAGTSIPRQKFINLVQQATQKAQNGDAQYAGLNGNQIQAKVMSMLQSQGISVSQ